MRPENITYVDHFFCKIPASKHFLCIINEEDIKCCLSEMRCNECENCAMKCALCLLTQTNSVDGRGYSSELLFLLKTLQNYCESKVQKSGCVCNVIAQ